MKITICGSMTFSTEMAKIGDELRARGHEVELPALLVDTIKDGEKSKMSLRDLVESRGIDTISDDDPVWQRKAEAIDDHFGKVSWADAVLIANYPKRDIDGYIGANTLMEMAVARFLGKKIYVLFPASSALQYKDEILGLLPIQLNGDTTKL